MEGIAEVIAKVVLSTAHFVREIKSLTKNSHLCNNKETSSAYFCHKKTNYETFFSCYVTAICKKMSK
jgi:hypothetical protein